MLSSVADYFFGSGNTDADSHNPVELKCMASEAGYAPHEGSGDAAQSFVPPSPSLGVTQLITYIDFFPRCIEASAERPEFGNFSSILEQVNQWLTANPNFIVLKCESVRQRILDGSTADFDSVLERLSSNGKNLFIHGLRLWLKGRKGGDNCPTQQIGCFHSVPWLKTDSDLSETTSYKLHPGRFQTLSQKIESLNASLRKHPLPGRILTVEQVTLRSSDPLEFPAWSPQRSCWMEEGLKTVTCITIFRIFYVLGEPALETIGIQDFIPKITKEALSAASRPQFQPFSDVVKSARHWLRDNKETRIVNIQSSFSKMEQKNSGKATLSRPDMVYTELDQTTMYLKVLSIMFVLKHKPAEISRLNLQHLKAPDDVSNTGTAGIHVHKAQHIKAADVVTSLVHETMTSELSSSPKDVTSSESEQMTSKESENTTTSDKSEVSEYGVYASDISCFSCKTFPAIRHGPKSFESFSRTVDRASYWMKCNKAPLLYVETVESLFTENMYGTGVKEDQVLSAVNRQLGRFFISSVWAYFCEPVEDLVLEQMSAPYVHTNHQHHESEEKF